MKKKSEVIVSVALVAALLVAHPSGASERRRPNVVFLLATNFISSKVSDSSLF